MLPGFLVERLWSFAVLPAPPPLGVRCLCRVVSCFSFCASAEDSIWAQCAEQGSRILILSWLGAGWSHLVIILANLNSDQRAALRTKCLMKPPKKVSEIFGKILRSGELEAALLEAFQSESFVPSD